MTSRILAAALSGTILLLSLAAAELIFRSVDGYQIWSFQLRQSTLPMSALSPDPGERFLSTVELADGVKAEWFHDEPRAPNRAVDLQLVKLDRLSEGTAVPSVDLAKAWNLSHLRAEPLCSGSRFDQYPGVILAFENSDSSPYPRYRHLPSRTTVAGLSTNRFGWRGEDIPLHRSPGTVRIAFLGASTTISHHSYPHAYPELVGHWLNLWSKDHAPGVTFEVMNAGRAGITSGDISAIMSQEVSPLRPDIVVYYEGSNQFWLDSIVTPQRTNAATSSKKSPLEALPT